MYRCRPKSVSGSKIKQTCHNGRRIEKSDYSTRHAVPFLLETPTEQESQAQVSYPLIVIRIFNRSNIAANIAANSIGHMLGNYMTTPLSVPSISFSLSLGSVSSRQRIIH